MNETLSIIMAVGVVILALWKITDLVFMLLEWSGLTGGFSKGGIVPDKLDYPHCYPIKYIPQTIDTDHGRRVYDVACRVYLNGLGNIQPDMNRSQWAVDRAVNLVNDVEKYCLDMDREKQEERSEQLKEMISNG